MKILFTILLTVHLTAQIQINELMSSNSTTIYDDSGESSDWIEIYNGGEESFNLAGYGLSDDEDDLYKWTFPSVNIDPNSHVLVFASDADNNSVQHWETVINWGDNWSYFIGTQEPPPNWKDINFDDSSWQTGPSGFGYGDGDDATIVPNTMSVFVRNFFNIESIDNIEEMLLHIDYDDSFVAYLNGTEVARSNIGTPGTPPPFDQGANQWREAQMYSGGFPERFDINLSEVNIFDGQNTLAIQLHNFDLVSSDMSLIPFLTLGMDEVPADPMGSPDLLNLNLSSLHSNFKISSSGERIYLTDLSNNIIDQVDSLLIPNDISFGRNPDGGSSWVFYPDATPGESNNESIGFESFCDAPDFSYDPGFYTSALSVSIAPNENGYPIYFTIDGSDPSSSSTIYQEPVALDQTTVLRASVIHPSCLSSQISTSTFLIEEGNNLPIVSLSTNPDNLFDWESGIYVMGSNASADYPYFGANFWEDWERPIHIEFFETDGSLGFSQDAGVKIFGGWSRGQDQKSLAIFARAGYGSKTINYQIFPDKEIDEFSSIVLRNSGNDWYSGSNWSTNSMLRDGMMTGLMQDTDIEYQEYRPAVVYINGEYWGIHNIREKVNEEFLAANNPGVDPDELDQLEANAGIIEGDNQAYLDMINFINSNNLGDQSNYETVEGLIDIDNFIDYNIAQIFYGNTDWPGNNIKFWRPYTADGKWRWILYDTDFGFGLVEWVGHNTLAFALEPNGPGWPNPPWSTFLLRSLMVNNEFKIKFINHFCYFLNTRFKASNVSAHISDVVNNISPEMPNHISRWGGSFYEWSNQHLGVIQNFGAQRDGYVFTHIRDRFNLNATSDITVSSLPSEGGSIKTSGQVIPEQHWTASYFEGIPIEFTAIANPGYVFSHWDGVDSEGSTASVTLYGDQSISAVFVESEFSPVILINEFLAANESINTDETGEYEDWVELYYNIPGVTSLDGYFLTDNLSEPDKWMFPDIEIEGEGHLLIWTDDDQEDGDLHTNFKLSAGGESVGLFDSDLNLIDEISFGEQSDDISYGRAFDGSNDWQFFDSPTPEESNIYNQGCSPGDVNCDDNVNVLDVVVLVELVLGASEPNPETLASADVNEDGELDVLDIVQLVSMILSY